MAAANYPRPREKQVLHSSNNIPKAEHQKLTLGTNESVGVLRGTSYGYQKELNKLDEDVYETETDEVLEQLKLTAECEAIIKKELQILQADERGKQALQKEIADIKDQQQKRFEILLARKNALNIERERSKRITARPLLSRSLKSLLKQKENRDPYLAFCEPSEDITTDVEEINNLENKENMDDEYQEQRRRVEKEWDNKAKKRFNEALKKDRHKKEQDDVFKEIEEAEKLHRLQKAKNYSEWGRLPCDIPDRLQNSEKQASMEDTVESVFKKSSSSKEHAIEDIEGYEDKWESKYKQIDSNMEAKMIDCVPRFIKENYTYLLGDEDLQPLRGRHSSLDDSTNELNVAYIESPTETVNSSEEIAAVISLLDQMRSERDEKYENEFKPLLEAEGSPKPESFDKAVETHILKQPTEDKAVDVQQTSSLENQVTSTSRSSQVDFMNAGVMSFKRRDLGSRIKNISESKMSPPNWSTPENQNGESWSSSSYRSIPPNHGMPNLCQFCDSPSCKTPLVEDQQLHKDCIPLSKSKQNTSSSQTIQVSDETLSAHSLNSVLIDIKSKLSSYVQIVADKYLSSVPDDHSNKNGENTEKQDKSQLMSKSTSFNRHSYFPASDNKSDSDKSLSDKSSYEDPPNVLSHVLSDTAFETSRRKIAAQSSDSFEKNHHQVSWSRKSRENEDISEHDGHDIISNAILNVFSNEDNNTDTSKSDTPDQLYKSNRDVTPGHYVRRELSTIPEMDSVFTNDTVQSETKKSVSSSTSLSYSQGYTSSEEIDTTSASLIDAPLSEVALIAKNIRFVTSSRELPKTTENVAKSLSGNKNSENVLDNIPSPNKSDQSLTTEMYVTQSLPVISGMLSSLQTPKLHSGVKMPSLISVSGVSTPSSITLDDFLTPKSVSAEGLSSVSTPLPSSVPSFFTPTTQTNKFDNLTPNSASSKSTPYSSSFYKPQARQTHLTNVGSALPQYFRDVSSINQASERSSSIASPKATPQEKQQEDVRPTSHFFPQDFNEGRESLKPLPFQSTPHHGQSNEVSHGEDQPEEDVLAHILPGSSHDLLKSKAGPSSTKEDQVGMGQMGAEAQYADSSGGSFKPMSCHTYLSTSSRAYIKSRYTADTEQTHSQKRNKGQAQHHMESKQATRSRNPVRSNDSSAIFQILTPHTYLSPPYSATRDDFFSHQSTDTQQDNRDDFISDQQVVEYRNRDESDESDEGLGLKPSSSNEDFGPTVQLRIKIPDYQFVSNRKERSKTSHKVFSSSSDDNQPINIRFAIHSHDGNDDKDIEDYHLEGDGSGCQQESAMANYLSQRSLKGEQYDQMFDQKNRDFDDKSAGDPARLINQPQQIDCSSDIFVPHLPAFDCNKDKASSEKKSEGLVAEKEMEQNMVNYSSSLSLTTDSSSDKTSSSSMGSVQSVLRTSQEVSSSTTTTSSLKDSASLPSVSSISSVSSLNSPNPILDAFRKKNLSIASSKTSPSGTPISYGSSETLSELSASKVTFQSTPIKSIESLIQETGILDEPDLTLQATELTIQPDSPVKQSNFPIQGITLESGIFSYNKTNTTSKSQPATTSSQPLCDSPSMMSFLQHEMSCFTPESKIAPQWKEDESSGSGDYKKRTKRLWNNLEEVRKRKEIEEKKKQMAKNRLKAKGYSKKFTPKKTT